MHYIAQEWVDLRMSHTAIAGPAHPDRIRHFPLL
jgi:hypothetical protein